MFSLLSNNFRKQTQAILIDGKALIVIVRHLYRFASNRLDMVGVVNDRCLFQPFEHNVLLASVSLALCLSGLFAINFLAFEGRAVVELAGGLRCVWLNVWHVFPLGFCVLWPGLPGSLGRLDFGLILTGRFDLITWGRSRLDPTISGCCAIGSRVFMLIRGMVRLFLAPASATTALSSAPGHDEGRQFDVWNLKFTWWMISFRESDKETTLASARRVVVSFIRRSQSFARFATAFASISYIRRGFAKKSAKWLLINRKVRW